MASLPGEHLHHLGVCASYKRRLCSALHPSGHPIGKVVKVQVKGQAVQFEFEALNRSGLICAGHGMQALRLHRGQAPGRSSRRTPGGGSLWYASALYE